MLTNLAVRFWKYTSCQDNLGRLEPQMFPQQLHWFFRRGELDWLCCRVKPENLGHVPPSARALLEREVDRDGQRRWDTALPQRHNRPRFSVHIARSVRCRLLSSLSTARASATTKLQPWEQQHRGQERLPRFGVPRRALRRLLVFLRGLACQARQEVLVNWSQNKYFLVPELTGYLNKYLTVKYYGQIQFLLDLKAG